MDVQAALDKIERDNKTDLALLRESTLPAVARAVLDLRRGLQAIAGDKMISALAMNQQIDAARAAAAKALDAADTAAKQAIANVRADLQAKTAVSLSTEEQLLEQMKLQNAQRALELMQRAGLDTMAMIDRAASSGDAAQLQALRADLQASAGTDHASQRSAKVYQEEIDKRELPLLGGMKQAARTIENELQAGSSNLNTTFQLVRGEVSGASGSYGGLRGPVTTVAD
jgi:hypothetical protein